MLRIEKENKLNQEGWEWYEDAADNFACQCGKTIINLEYIRSNLHALLGRRRPSNQGLSFIPMYEKNALKTTQSGFVELLTSSPKEEILQKFIQENPILLHQFPAERIIPKPPIFSQYVADFAILTAQKELLFIESEKASTKLMKKNGDRASDLVHAFDQVRHWLQIIDEHRLGVLDDLNIDRNEVSTIRGVVIAGRETGYDAQKLRHLKMHKEERISFLTYDDLLFALDSLLKNFDNL